METNQQMFFIIVGSNIFIFVHILPQINVFEWS